MRISDWSSDVCSSDLSAAEPRGRGGPLSQRARQAEGGGAEQEQAQGFLITRRARGDSRRMCGIIGILGEAPVAPLLLDGLKRLEYRGYDSAGIATLRNGAIDRRRAEGRSEEHTSELQSLMRISYAGFCLQKKK